MPFHSLSSVNSSPLPIIAFACEKWTFLREYWYPTLRRGNAARVPWLSVGLSGRNHDGSIDR